MAATHAEPWIDPRPLSVHFRRGELGLRAEVEDENRTIRDTGETFTRETTTLAPSTEIALDGSVYHPYLLSFSMIAELVWLAEEIDEQFSATDDRSRSVDDVVERYYASLDFLKQKPYAWSIYAQRTSLDRDDDLFTRTRVDAEQYGLRAGYRDGAYPSTLAISHSSETSDELARPTERTVDNASATITHNGEGLNRSRLHLVYSADEYRDRDLMPTKTNRREARLEDRRYWGADDQVRLRSIGRYRIHDRRGVETELMDLREQLMIYHQDHLRSEYTYGLLQQAVGGTDRMTHEARAALVHDLYKSLTSTLAANSRIARADGDDAGGDTDRYGIRWDEAYRKLLSDWGRLDLGTSLGLYTEERMGGQGQFRVIDESYVLTDTSPALLSQANVQPGSVDVFDAVNNIPYSEGLDYVLVPVGAFVELRRTPGSAIPNGRRVLVSYIADRPPSDNFTASDNRGNVRLSLWGGGLSVYGRYHELKHRGGESFVLYDVQDTVLGVEGRRGPLRVGAEYRSYDAEVGPYESRRAFQGLELRPFKPTVLRVDLEQTETDYLDTDETLRVFGAAARCKSRVNASLALGLEAAYRRERGERGVRLDRDLKRAAADLSFWVGDLTVFLKYIYEDESFRSSDQENHYGLVKVTRKL